MNGKTRIAIVLDELLKWQGGVEYARNLLLALRERNRSRPEDPAEVLVICRTSVPPRLEEAFRPLADEWHVGSAASREGLFSLVHQARASLAFPAYCDEPSRERYAHWIYDFQHKKLAAMFSGPELEQRERAVREIIEFAEWIVVSSEACRRDLEAYYPEAAARARVIRFATFPLEAWYAGDPDDARRALGLPEQYAMVCNQFWQHKRHLDVLDALAELKRRGVAVPLVLTGPLHDYRQPDYPYEVLRRMHELGLWPQIYLLGLLPRPTQIQLMRGASFVIQPSSFEGWSTVVEDAKTFGRPLVVSDLDVHREQAPDPAIFFPVGDVPKLADAIGRAWETYRTGFDAARERAAAEAARRRALAFAEAFIELARAPRPEVRPARPPAPEKQQAASPAAAGPAELLSRIEALDRERRIRTEAVLALEKQLDEKDRLISLLHRACRIRDEKIRRLHGHRWTWLGRKSGLMPDINKQVDREMGPDGPEC